MFLAVFFGKALHHVVRRMCMCIGDVVCGDPHEQFIHAMASKIINFLNI